ncbi:WD40 repeat-like protein [Sistotremastrum niveocremeum HHB9708]|uniref:WD40 repeat-like protein n=1 Tax=Sistotremastrum niveocremeum HHB9708 TaxID=1314777 RepID=A0A164P4R9_9AGAM|nr:WD40 repeat-like protein [Sistotremastrum niveocremeum HHB9708]
MKLPESQNTSVDTLSNGAGPSNGHSANGTKNGVHASSSVAKLSLLGDSLYQDSQIGREEFIRLVIQSLRDVGYIESAATLEAESGYTMETPQVAEFRQRILDGEWTRAETALETLGVTDPDELNATKFLLSQQKYLELLESQQISSALSVLRNELAPLNIPMDKLHTLSSYMMCANPEDLRHRSRWDGAAGTSRRRLLIDLQRYIPSAVMIPARRFETLLEQARSYQQMSCLYHNSRAPFSLYADHSCSRAEFPTLTTYILQEHKDEVWHIQWSHDGRFLASASKDRTAIIWRIERETAPYVREVSLEHVLRDHQYPVNCIAWSPDDKFLLTSSDSIIKIWNASTGLCTKELKEIPDGHTDTVMSLAWLPDKSGFVSGGMDRKIIIWNTDGSKRESYGPTSIRIADLAITPDQSRIVAVGLIRTPTPSPASTSNPSLPEGGASAAIMPGSASQVDHRILLFDMHTKQEEVNIKLEGDLTSVKTSSDSKYCIVNHSPDELLMWDLDQPRMTRKFTGQKQGKHIIKCCFGGIDDNFVVSGSEDSKVYVWHRDTGVLLEILKGHGKGSVNSVAWNPTEERMFASCSDDGTIRIWEPQPLDPADDESPISIKGKERQRNLNDSISIS